MKKILFLAGLVCSANISYSSEGNQDTITAEIVDSTLLANAKKYELVDSILQNLEYQTGKVIISDDLATVTVPEGYGFLKATDARYVLEDAWGNPADKDVLGMLVQRKVDLLDADSWAIVYSYEEEGYVKDDDAEDINYDELLEDIQQQTHENNPERVKEGFPEMEIIGWAKTPYYDKGTHKLHWAKEIRFGQDSLHTLNYNIRMLGRKGVLVMNVIAGMDNIKTVEANINTILASTDFNAGKRYTDFDSDVDKVAAYGLGGLIAGGVLLKTGLLAKIGIFLLKAWKIIAFALLGGFAFLRNKISGLFKAKRENRNM